MSMRLLSSSRHLSLHGLPAAYSRAFSRKYRHGPQSQSQRAYRQVVRAESLVSDVSDDVENVIMNNYAAALNELPSKYRVLVLDSSYRPIEIINWKRAICLDLFNKVDVLEYYDMYVRSAYAEHFIPAVLRVRMYIKGLNSQQVSVSRRNIIARDKNTCQYCGSRTSILTIDHVVPKHQGGQWTWENLVAACTDCNARKGAKSLKQLKWALRSQPRAPSAYELNMHLTSSNFNINSAPKEWASYLYRL